MNTVRNLSILLLPLLFVLPQRGGDALPAPLQQMVETERAFAKRATVVGVRDAFLEYFADAALRFTTQPERYKPYLEQRPSVPPTIVELLWEPRYGDVAASGELGYLTGPATRIVHGEKPELPSYSCYFSIWKRQPDGTFRVFIDQGISTPGPAPFEPGFTRAESAHRYQEPPAQRPPGDAQTTLAQADRALAGAASGRASVRRFFAAPARVYRDGTMPLVGADALRRFEDETGGGVRHEPLYAEAAASGDLGFSYGRYHRAGSSQERAESGHYIRVWTRDVRGSWHVVIDVHAPAPRS